MHACVPYMLPIWTTNSDNDPTLAFVVCTFGKHQISSNPLPDISIFPPSLWRCMHVLTLCFIVGAQVPETWLTFVYWHVAWHAWMFSIQTAGECMLTFMFLLLFSFLIANISTNVLQFVWCMDVFLLRFIVPPIRRILAPTTIQAWYFFVVCAQVVSSKFHDLRCQIFQFPHLLLAFWTMHACVVIVYECATNLTDLRYLKCDWLLCICMWFGTRKCVSF